MRLNDLEYRKERLSLLELFELSKLAPDSMPEQAMEIKVREIIGEALDFTFKLTEANK